MGWACGCSPATGRRSIKRSQSIARLHATPRETFHQEQQTKRLPTGADVLPLAKIGLRGFPPPAAANPDTAPPENRRAAFGGGLQGCPRGASARAAGGVRLVVLERDFLIRASLASQKAPATSVLPRDGRSRYSTGQVRRECTVG